MKSVHAARIAIAAVMLASVGCSPAFTTRDKLTLSFYSIVSSAAETELFLDRLQKREATSVYARTYADSLADAIRQNRQELQGHPPAKGLESAFAECSQEYEVLFETVKGLKGALNNQNALAAAKTRMETIRKKAEQSLHTTELSGIEDRASRTGTSGAGQETRPTILSVYEKTDRHWVNNLRHKAAL